MSANRSTAVMARRAAAPDALDYFPTPPWATRALCAFLLEQGQALGELSCWEPACGEMHMARPLGEYFRRVEATDVHRYSLEHGICDFLIESAGRRVDWVITNPPFLLGQRFVETALRCATVGAAMLVRTAFTEGSARHRDLFAPAPPAFVLQFVERVTLLQFVERVTLLQGRLIQSGAADPFNLGDDGEPKKASNATSYCWMVWMHGRDDTRFRWLADCRARLERPGDYPAYADQWAEIAKAPAEGGLL